MSEPDPMARDAALATRESSRLCRHGASAAIERPVLEVKLPIKVSGAQ
ncbi:hypothetical protein [Roseateles sp.]